MGWLIIAFLIVTLFTAISNALAHSQDMSNNYSLYIKWKAITLISGYVAIILFVVMIGEAVGGASI